MVFAKSPQSDSTLLAPNEKELPNVALEAEWTRFLNGGLSQFIAPVDLMFSQPRIHKTGFRAQTRTIDLEPMLRLTVVLLCSVEAMASLVRDQVLRRRHPKLWAHNFGRDCGERV
jgi:hypothetical protein